MMETCVPSILVPNVFMKGVIAVIEPMREPS